MRHVGLDRAGRAVLRGVDWTISPGERWVLLGANGAGKTQLLKLVSGSVWPTPRAGTVREYVRAAVRLRTPDGVMDEMAYVGPERQDRYERYGWDFLARDVVGTGLHRTDIPLEPLTASGRRTAERLLGRLSLGHLAARRFLTLSYGERRLVLLARALAARPKLLLLDELLGGLDATNHAAALSFLESTARSALPWVLATHRLEDVPKSATHMLWLEKGRVVYRGRIARAPLARWLDAGEIARPSRAVATRPGRARGMLVRMTDASVYLDGHPVLRNVSLEVHRGECWVVHGPNGSGKSTLLRTIYGDHAVAWGGRIERAGIAPGVTLERFKRRVGFVAPHLQSLAAAMRSVLGDRAATRRGALVPPEPRDLTVSELVQSGRSASVGLDSAPSASDRRAAENALAAFGLSTLASRTLAELSYGELRRVFFARAWVNHPRLLLLDEPFAGVDAPTRADLLGRVAALAEGAATIVLATHHRAEWPRGATHELELRAGRVRYAGPIRCRGRM